MHTLTQHYANFTFIFFHIKNTSQIFSNIVSSNETTYDDK